jgi:hypothetical protein
MNAIGFDWFVNQGTGCTADGVLGLRKLAFPSIANSPDPKSIDKCLRGGVDRAN